MNIFTSAPPQTETEAPPVTRARRQTLSFIRSRHAIISVLALVIVGQLLGNVFAVQRLATAVKDVRVWILNGIEPAVTTGAEPPPNEIIYNFGWRIYMEQNNWPLDGSVEFEQQIVALYDNNLITPNYERQLRQELKKLQDEPWKIKNRVRGFQLSPSHEYSESLLSAYTKHGPWEVRFTGYLKEYQNGILLNNLRIVVDVVVIHQDKKPEENLYGLSIDSYTIRDKQEIKL